MRPRSPSLGGSDEGWRVNETAPAGRDRCGVAAPRLEEETKYESRRSGNPSRRGLESKEGVGRVIKFGGVVERVGRRLA